MFGIRYVRTRRNFACEPKTALKYKVYLKQQRQKLGVLLRSSIVKGPGKTLEFMKTRLVSVLEQGGWEQGSGEGCGPK